MLVSTSIIFPSANSTGYLVSMVDGTTPIKELNSMEVRLLLARFHALAIITSFALTSGPSKVLLGDYEMWKLRIEQYFQIQDYALWEVIEYGNSFKPVPRTTTNADGTSTSTIAVLVTSEEKTQKKNDLKARSMLLMALLNEHLLTSSQYEDAKTLFEAIKARFGCNDATKKT
ncbi:hypothetical protein Tco_0639956 [Tanacetum coccineum]